MAWWQFKLLLRLVLAGFAALSAWELQTRLRVRNRRLDQALDAGVVKASIVQAVEGGYRKHHAAVTREESGFVLSVTSLNERGDTERLVERFDSRQGLERFLQEKTVFRMGDFVRGRE
ncbi:hypothetical protein [Stutzerimonas azotifigens]|uniref:hypothetical protein n=1 Tax=Stutzerimonas azotifigens TaxID=291995 RepID=UPI0003FC8924|nr:hypothetical protein [Stutzerimonas azotifigens]